MSLTELIVSIAGDMSKLSQTMKQVTDDVGQAGKSIQDIGKNLTSAGQSLTMGVTAPILAGGAAFTAAAKLGSDFEKDMAQVYTLLPNLTKDAFADMSADTLQFAKDMRIPTDEVLPAMYDAISAGVPTDNIFSFLETSQKAAIAGNTDLGTSVDALTSIVNAYGSENLNVADASDILFTGVRLGKTTFEELQQSLFQVIPTASSLGVPLEDVTAALAAMTAQGTPTSIATTQLRQMFVELSKEGSGAAATFEDIAGKTFPQFIAEGGSLQDALGMMSEGFADSSPAAKELQTRMMELADPTSGLALEFESLTGKTFKEFQKEGGNASDALKTLGINTDETDARLSDMFGSVEAGNAVISLTSRDGEILNKVMGEMTDTAGATDDAFTKMNETSSRAFEAMNADIKNAVTEMGLRLLPVIQDTLVPLLTDTLIPAFEMVIEFIGDVAEAFNTLPQPVKVIILAIVAFLAALGPLLVIIGSVVSAVGTMAAAFGTGGILAGALVTAKAVIASIITAIGGISLPILAIVAVLAVLALAWKNNWFDIQGKTKAAIDFIVTQAKALWKALGDTWNAIIKAGGDLERGIDDTTKAVSDAINTLKNIANTTWNAIKTTFSDAINYIVNYVSQFATNLRARLLDSIQSVENFKAQAVAKWNEIKNNILNILNNIVTDLVTFAANILAKLNTSISNVINFRSLVSAAWTATKTAVLAILNGIISDLVAWISNQAARFSDSIGRLNTFKTQVTTAWTATKTAVLGVLNGIISDLVAWISNQAARFADSISRLNTFKSQVTTAWTATKTAVLGVLNGIISDLMAWISNQAARFSDSISRLNTFKSQATAAWTSIKSTVLGVLNGIISDFTAWVSNQAAKLNDMISRYNTFKNNVASAWNSIKTTIQTALNGIISTLDTATNKVGTAINNMVSAIKNKGTEFYNAGAAIINQLKAGVESKINSIKDSINSLTSWISNNLPHSPAKEGPLSKAIDFGSYISKPLTSTVKSTISQAASSGKSIISSLASGIKSAASAVGTAIKSVTTKVRSYLPFSPADIGPFAELPNWDAVFYDPMLESIKKTAELTAPLEATLGKVNNPLKKFGAGFGKLAGFGDVINNSGDNITVGPNTISNGMDLQTILDYIDKRAAERRRARGMYR